MSWNDVARITEYPFKQLIKKKEGGNKTPKYVIRLSDSQSMPSSIQWILPRICPWHYKFDLINYHIYNNMVDYLALAYICWHLTLYLFGCIWWNRYEQVVVFLKFLFWRFLYQCLYGTFKVFYHVIYCGLYLFFCKAHRGICDPQCAINGVLLLLSEFIL